jgi:integrase
MANQYGVRPRGKRFIARPYIPGRGHAYAGTFDTAEEATKAAIAKIEAERKLPANKETVASFAARWVGDFPRPKESTNDRYCSDAQRFARKVGAAKKLHEVTVPEARAYAQKHRHDLGALRAMFSDARRDGLVLENPFAELGISKGRGRKDIVAITADELDVLADLALRTHGKDFGPIFRSVVLFAAYTGLRPGELFGLEWDDIDFKGETIHVQRQFHKRRLTLPKNGKARRVFLPPPAAQALRAMPRTVGVAHVFPGKEDQRITQSALSGYWKPVRVAFEASRNSEADLSFYALRHRCATMLVEQGIESWIVAKQLGHDDGGRLVEQTYSHPSDQVARERLRRAFAEPTKLRAVEDAEAANG